MIKAIIFDLDNTLLDFMKMKLISINAAVDGMIKSGMNIDKNKSIDEIFHIYDSKGYEHQEVFNEFISNKLKTINYKYLAAAIVEYKKAKDDLETLETASEAPRAIQKVKETDLGKKFATGSSVTKVPSGGEEIVVQGDVSEEIEEFLLEKYPVIPEDNIELVEDKKKKAGAGAPAG